MNLFDKKQIKDLESFVKLVRGLDFEPTNFLEIGSRDGHHAEYIRKELGIDKTKTYIVEPNPLQYPKISKLYPDFKLFTSAISDTEGELPFYQIDTGHDDFDGISGLLDRPDLYKHHNTNIIKVPVIKGDTLIKKIGENIDICKIDVEGATYNVLNGLGKDLNNIKVLQIETEDVEIWKDQKTTSDISDFLINKGFTLHDESLHNTIWGIQRDQIWVNNDILTKKFKRAYITHCDEIYAPIVDKMLETVKEFSDIPCIVYILNSDLKLKNADLTVRFNADIREGSSFIKNSPDGNKYISRQTSKVYDIITKKPNITLDCLNKYADHVVYLDGDSIATPRIDDLFNYVNDNHPMFTQGLLEYMMIGGPDYEKYHPWNGNPFEEIENEQIMHSGRSLETHVCKLLGVDESFRRNKRFGYFQTGYFSAIKSNIPFIKEWIDLCELDEIKNNHNKYAPFHEETLVNVLLWKYKWNECMPLVYVNCTSPERVIETYNAKFDPNQPVTTQNDMWFKTPPRLKDVKVFHGEKRPEIVDKIVKEIKNQESLKILYVVHHLSTGGMPQFLLKRIETLLDTDLKLHVIELDNYSNDFVVQKNKLKELLGNNLHLANDTDKNTRLLNLIEDLKPDVIHFEECPESMDRKLDESTLDKIYRNDRTYQIIETCHNIWMNNERKIWHPNSYMYCTPYHPENNFKNTESAGSVVEYPFENLVPSDSEKSSSKLELNMDESKIHILNVGLWTSGKNQGEAVEIARAMQDLYPDKFLFHFVGNQAGNFKEYWEPITKNLPENVKIWGERSDVNLFLKAADVFMFNSTWECNPLVLREAISHGLITFSRNLPQYMDMYEKYIFKLENDINETIKIFIEGLEQSLQLDPPKNDLKRFKNKMLEHYSQKYPNVEIKKEGKFRVEWNGSIKLHVDSVPSDNCHVKFIEDNKVVYSSNLKKGHWYAPGKNWFIPWKIEVYENDKLIWNWNYEPKNNEICIKFDSSSLGDTISFMGQIKSFKEYWGLDKVYVFTHKNWLFDIDGYKKIGIEILDWDNFKTIQKPIITLGVFYEIEYPWKKHEHKNDWRKIHLSQIASDRLGIPLDEINARPLMNPTFKNAIKPKREKPIVTFATASTAQSKYWNRENGWQNLVNEMSDYHWVHCSKEKHHNLNTEQSPEALEEVAGFMLASKFFIGISSGLTWFAWALNVPTFSISGFTPEVVERIEGITTIQNPRVCNSCWAWDVFDKGDWNWCPAYKGTDRQFECSKEITEEMVINKINETI